MIQADYAAMEGLLFDHYKDAVISLKPNRDKCTHVSCIYGLNLHECSDDQYRLKIMKYAFAYGGNPNPKIKGTITGRLTGITA